MFFAASMRFDILARCLPLGVNGRLRARMTDPVFPLPYFFIALYVR
jgi:hypothetical protein